MTDAIQFPLTQPELAQEVSGVTLRRTVHPSGLRVLTEHTPGARSVSIGFWVPVGSRDEQADHSGKAGSLGSTHFLEHLLFKGTPTRSAYVIADAFDRIGADHNALTAKEFTCYHAKVRDLDLPKAVTVLTDMVTNSVLDQQEFETERGVILEELAMAADDLSDVAHEQFFQAVLGSHPLGRPIGGTPQTIREASRDAVFEHYRARYAPPTLVVTAAGAVDHDALVDMLVTELDGAGGVWDPSVLRDPHPRRDREPAKITDAVADSRVEKTSEQVHLVLGSQGLPAGDSRRFAFGLMNAALGGGMSSRLFQEIREKRGLAYSAYSFGGSYSDAGVFGMYAACNPEKAAEVLTLASAELEKLAATGVTESERSRALGQIAGSSALALEDNDTRMGRLARAELGTGELLDLDRSLERFRAVTNDDIRDMAATLLEQASTRVAVGSIAKTGL